MSVDLITHPDMLKHDTGAGHPERKERLEFLLDHLGRSDIHSSLRRTEGEPAPRSAITAVHPESHVAWIEQSCKDGIGLLDDGDTFVVLESFHAALLAAGSVMKGVDAVMKGEAQAAFCAVRPPGHHAERSKVMGFCLLNSIAIGARHAQHAFGLKRVAIVDWDVHHGNGTQEVFYDDPSVLFISLHQYPHWPGTGSRIERGRGAGEGFTLNIPMAPGSGDEEYLRAIKGEVVPALESFKPEILILSAGFDAHRLDPLANINLSDHVFGQMTDILLDVTDRHCPNRIVSVLEGGYHLEALAASVEAHLRALCRLGNQGLSDTKLTSRT
jgi:acetoin utilization deacetylase AcuC-like enzyme